MSPSTTTRDPAISDDEIDYLLALANGYLATPLSRADIVWTYSGVRPLYDDGSSDPSAVTRDYVLKVDAGGDGPRAAGAVDLRRQDHDVPQAGRERARRVEAVLSRRWERCGRTTEALPGGDLPAGGIDAWTAELQRRFAGLSAAVVRGIARRHGTLALAGARRREVRADLGEDFGNGLTAREIDVSA